MAMRLNVVALGVRDPRATEMVRYFASTVLLKRKAGWKEKR